MTIKINKRRFIRVEVTRDDPRITLAHWHLYADRYANKLEANDAVRRALTTGTHPYRAARIIEEYGVEQPAYVGQRFEVTK
jgi:hypothetical protein